MPSKRQQQADLAKAALNSVFDGSHTEGRVPNIFKNAPTEAPEPPPKSESPGERPPRVTGLQLALPRGGFTHPEQGGYFMMPKEFKAILALEKKAVSQVVYEVIEQTIGWEDPGGRGGRREWVRLSLRHFQMACAMSLSQAQSGLKIAIQNGYITRRPDRARGGYEYSIVWRDSDRT